MPIPNLNPDGLLPGGIHDCSLEEAQDRFGRFQISDRRVRLWAKFSEFIREAKAGALAQAVLLDGSFVTAKPDPNDIDLVVVLPETHVFSADLPLLQYNALDQKRVRRRFQCDIIVVKNASENLEWAIAFFAQVRQQPGLKKGLLRIVL